MNQLLKPPFLTTLVTFLIVFKSYGIDFVDHSQYTINEPTKSWKELDFDDASWEKSLGGLGQRTQESTRIGTVWSTQSVWVRKEYVLKKIPNKLALLFWGKEKCEIYLNGKHVDIDSQNISDYKVFSLDESDKTILKTGRNVIAVHSHQSNRWKKFLDVHLVDMEKIPSLPEVKPTKPVFSTLKTQWGASVTPDNAWTEYPRPQFKRLGWKNLNGEWDYAITSNNQSKSPSHWDGKILVPYSLESSLSGVRRLLNPKEVLWYRCQFSQSKDKDKRVLLNFEAVDYRCEVLVNGIPVGTHIGGNNPFSFDITEEVKKGSNELIVKVEDNTDEFQLKGKQTLNPENIRYTQVSGIWQTVWIEEVPQNYIKRVKITTPDPLGTIIVEPSVLGSGKFKVLVKDGSKTVDSAFVDLKTGKESIELIINNPKLWSPSNPFLYDLEFHLLDSSDSYSDKVSSYIGIRTLGKTKDKNGHWRFTLNGETIFHWGPLDQGWWPDGLLTPPSDEAMLFEIEWLKKAGFNMIRKHIKVEPRRYYYHCDRLGMLVWQDHLSGGHKGGDFSSSPKWTRLDINPKDANWSVKQHRQFMKELNELITSLENHPCIVSWIPFNEAWGQHETMKVGKWMTKRDSSRSLNIASGGNFWPVGDIVDHHSYPHPKFPFYNNKKGRFNNYIKVIGEFGGHGYYIKGHVWNENTRRWGYGGLPKDKTEFKERYLESLNKLNKLRHLGISGGVYTQTTDVEGEINGLMTYDRKVIKISADELAELHQILFKN